MIWGYHYFRKHPHRNFVSFFFEGEEVTGILLFFLGGWNFVIKKGASDFFGGLACAIIRCIIILSFIPKKKLKQISWITRYMGKTFWEVPSSTLLERSFRWYRLPGWNDPRFCNDMNHEIVIGSASRILTMAYDILPIYIYIYPWVGISSLVYSKKIWVNCSLLTLAFS